MQKEFKVPEEKPEWESFVAQHPDAVTKFDAEVWTVTYGLQKVVVDSIADVSDLQIRLALNASGLRAGVETYVEHADQDTKDWWDRAIKFERNNPMVLAAASALGVTQKQLDNLWLLAVTI
jgi:hypothetical protein